MAAEKEPVGIEELRLLHARKTGALIEASLVTGGKLAGGSSEEIEALRIYGRGIGLAFQVTDDILNITGDPDKMGKATGTDAKRHKSTYPTLIGLERSREYAGELIDNALQAIDLFGSKADPLAEIARYILVRDR